MVGTHEPLLSHVGCNTLVSDSCLVGWLCAHLVPNSALTDRMEAGEGRLERTSERKGVGSHPDRLV